ncbi:hypothetical protein [Streptomyces sp. NBC_01236]|uniref:hypothetical protein n=1 Tax=Streptomyces sp. NBC_01236 TaxID=2903789 RepID=UPI002E115BBB|nr:hypothetical protein OG324_10165 [Streptomyces sp. NBC_01236]
MTTTTRPEQQQAPDGIAPGQGLITASYGVRGGTWTDTPRITPLTATLAIVGG